MSQWEPVSVACCWAEIIAPTHGSHETLSWQCGMLSCVSGDERNSFQPAAIRAQPPVQIAKPDLGFFDSARRWYFPETSLSARFSSEVRLSIPLFAILSRIKSICKFSPLCFGRFGPRFQALFPLLKNANVGKNIGLTQR